MEARKIQKGDRLVLTGLVEYRHPVLAVDGSEVTFKDARSGDEFRVTLDLDRLTQKRKGSKTWTAPEGTWRDIR